ncbi:GNAT family N-acetyltransferase [Thermopolyspora sp. NPDC052614]|uniref:GNAT family N-acetyltransferase n=1 Tax=Thermopolyspora sp. NPDC052614 TaxID=3155682 RepID=UPI0034465AE2
MHTIERLSPEQFARSVKELGGLLADVVARGASVGFLHPFGHDAATDWWRARHPEVSQGLLTVWAARASAGGEIVGTVGLARAGKANGAHRAEIVKLMVHPAARGQGLGRALLHTAEQAAARAGLTLLLLDTVTGTPADRLYDSAGWTRYGIVPGYAADPRGNLEDCSFYYKRLAPV